MKRKLILLFTSPLLVGSLISAVSCGSNKEPEKKAVYHFEGGKLNIGEINLVDYSVPGQWKLYKDNDVIQVTKWEIAVDSSSSILSKKIKIDDGLISINCAGLAPKTIYKFKISATNLGKKYTSDEITFSISDKLFEITGGTETFDQEFEENYVFVDDKPWKLCDTATHQEITENVHWSVKSDFSELDVSISNDKIITINTKGLKTGATYSYSVVCTYAGEIYQSKQIFFKMKDKFDFFCEKTNLGELKVNDSRTIPERVYFRKNGINIDEQELSLWSIVDTGEAGLVKNGNVVINKGYITLKWTNSLGGGTYRFKVSVKYKEAICESDFKFKFTTPVILELSGGTLDFKEISYKSETIIDTNQWTLFENSEPVKEEYKLELINKSGFDIPEGSVIINDERKLEINPSSLPTGKKYTFTVHTTFKGVSIESAEITFNISDKYEVKGGSSNIVLNEDHSITEDKNQWKFYKNDVPVVSAEGDVHWVIDDSKIKDIEIESNCIKVDDGWVSIDGEKLSYSEHAIFQVKVEYKGQTFSSGHITFDTYDLEPTPEDQLTYELITEESEEYYTVSASKLALTNLENLIVPSTYNGKHVKAIGAKGFQNCGKLKSVYIPSSITSIGDFAFSYCQLEKIRISTKNEHYGLAKNIPNTGSILVKRQDSSQPFNLEKDLSNIAGSLVAGVIDLSNTVEPSESEPVYKSQIFKGCYGLQTIKFTNMNVAIFGSEFFKDCINLTSIEFPNNFIRINARAFENCEKLKQMYFSPQTTDVGEQICNGCTSLETLTIYNSQSIIGWKDFFTNCTSIKEMIVVKTDKSWLMERYKAASGWKTWIKDSNITIKESE